MWVWVGCYVIVYCTSSMNFIFVSQLQTYYIATFSINFCVTLWALNWVDVCDTVSSSQSNLENQVRQVLGHYKLEHFYSSQVSLWRWIQCNLSLIPVQPGPYMHYTKCIEEGIGCNVEMVQGLQEDLAQRRASLWQELAEAQGLQGEDVLLANITEEEIAHQMQGCVLSQLHLKQVDTTFSLFMGSMYGPLTLSLSFPVFCFDF